RRCRRSDRSRGRARRWIPRGRLARGGGATRAGRGRTLRVPHRVDAVKIVDWTEAHAHEVQRWQYEPPYDFYDLASDPEDEAAMLDPARAEHHRAVLDERGRLEAFWYFDWHREVVEVGIGLRPDLTGRGLGEALLRAQLEYASQNWQPETFRLF